MEFKIGDPVVYVDGHGREHPALLTAIWDGHGVEADDEAEDVASVNLVYVSDDEARNDPYGRQIERESSVVHESNQSAHGMFWRRP